MVTFVLLITITYQLAFYIKFTYIWGALIFSFSFYFLGIRALIKGKSISPTPSIKRLEDGERLLEKVNQLMHSDRLYANQRLKLDDVAKKN
ncbi:MAG: hypothetical protein AAF789_01590 [Bacteroidota bacterium]